MSNYRRLRSAGSTWFFTVNLLDRRRDPMLVRYIDHLRTCVVIERARRPFVIVGWVVLPNHMHWLWRLPADDTDYSTRWRRIKTDFSRGFKGGEQRSDVRHERGKRGIWQRRFWEHRIRDEDDLRRHLDYIHFNPVKHGFADSPIDWPHSSFHEYVLKGTYPNDWGSTGVPAFEDFETGEGRCKL
ncbi:MAG: transposase [Dokdonella sp.]